MTPRERMLAIGVLLVAVLAGGGLLFHQLFLVPLADREAGITILQEKLDKNNERINQIESERPKLERARQLSLPPDINFSQREYEKQLFELMQASGIESPTITPKQADEKSGPAIAGKGPIYTKLSFTVQAHASLASLVAMLEGFYHTPLLQQIKLLTIQRPLTPATQQQRPGQGQGQGELDLTMNVEALIVNGTDSRQQLLPGISRRLAAADLLIGMTGQPGMIALVPWVVGPTGQFGPGTLASPKRDYAAVAEKNIFMGRTRLASDETAPLVMTRYVHLTDITTNFRRAEAFLYNRADGRFTRLRAEVGFDSFRILDDKGEDVVKGKVVRIDGRELIFRVDDKFYLMHVGQSLADTMKKSLSKDEQKKLGLTPPQDIVKRTEPPE